MKQEIKIDDIVYIHIGGLNGNPLVACKVIHDFMFDDDKYFVCCISHNLGYNMYVRERWAISRTPEGPIELFQN